MGSSTSPTPHMSSSSSAPTPSAQKGAARLARTKQLHRVLFGQTSPIRSYDLLTEDHPYRWYDRREQIRFKAWARGLAFVGVFLGCMMVLGFIGSIVLGFLLAASSSFDWTELESLNSITELSPSSLPMAIASVLQLVASVVAYCVVVLVMEQRRKPAELAPNRMADIVRGIVAALVCIGVSIGVIALFGGYRIVGFDAAYNPWLDLLVLGLVAGVSEEIMMRGILLRLTEESLGSWGAVIVSALVFGLIHIGNADGTLWGGLAISIEAGLLFGAIYLATRSLWWCMGFHFMWNIAEGPIFGSAVSGNGEQQSWLVPQWNGPEWLTGGTFGLEASVVPVVLLGGLAIALLVHLQRQGLMVESLKARKRRLSVAD